LLDAAGSGVAVNGRGLLSAPPAQFVRDEGRPVKVVAWAGPWVIDERWWDDDRRRRVARVQVLTDDGAAWLLTLESGEWSIEAIYD
jgi:protein ImuB